MILTIHDAWLSSTNCLASYPGSLFSSNIAQELKATKDNVIIVHLESREPGPSYHVHDVKVEPKVEPID